MSQTHWLRRRSRLALLALAAILIAGLAVGLTSAFASSGSPSPAAGKTILRIGWTNDPDNLNPFIGYESSSWEIFHLNYDLLFGFDAKTLRPTPELAAEVPTQANGGISADGKTYTIKLRHNVKWQDGQAFTAADVAFTFNYIMKNDLSQFTSYTAFFKSVTALDPYTVQIVCTKPKATMGDLWVTIVPEHVWKNVSPQDAAKKFENPPPIVGTGPFQVVEVKKGQFVRLQANKSYWRGAPKIDQIIFQTYQNADTMVQDLKSGAIQGAWGLNGAQLQTLKSAPEVYGFDFVTKGFDELAFNCYTGSASKGSPALRDVNFRRALNWAIDKQKLVQVAYQGYGRPGDSLMQSDYWQPPLDYHWDPASAGKAYGYDPAKCKAALDAAGYKDVNGDGFRELPNGKPMKLRLWARSESSTSQNSGRFIAGWFKDVGLNINFAVIEDGTISDGIYAMKGNAYAPDFDMFLWGWGGDPDPDWMLSVFTSDQVGGGWSDCGWRNKAYDAAVAAQKVELDPQKRKELIYKAQEIFYDDSPYIVLAYPNDIEGVNTNQAGAKGTWTGWIASPGEITDSPHGGVFYTADNIDSYIYVSKATATTATTSSSSTSAIIAIVLAALVVIAVVAWFLIRRGRRQTEEA